MKVLLVGGTGFLGSALAEALTARGHALLLLTRPESQTPATTPRVRWSYLQGPPPVDVWEGVEAVVNLAGETARGRWTVAKRRKIYDSRVETTNQLVAGMSTLSRPPGFLLVMSSIGYYGDRGDETLTEEATAGHDWVASLWRQAEAAGMAAEALGVTVARARTGIVLGRDGGAIPPLRRLGKLGLLGPVGSGRQWWSWIHKKDVVDFFVHLLESGIGGAFNLASPDPRRQRDWAATMARVLRRPGFFPAPAFGVKAVVGGFAVELLASRRVVPAAIQASGFQYSFPELQPALEDVLSG